MRPSISRLLSRAAVLLVLAALPAGAAEAATAAPVAPRDGGLSIAGCPTRDTNVGSRYFSLLRSVDRAEFAIDGALPAGLSLDPESGAISGVPTSIESTRFTVKATLGDETVAYGPCAIEVGPSLNPPMLATGCPIDDAVVTRPYRFAMAASGPAGMTFAASGLPSGLSVDPVSGLISGTPTAVGSSTVSVVVSGLGGVSAKIGCSMTVRPPAPPAIRACPSSDAVVGAAYASRIVADSTETLDYGASWLPAGLDIDHATGAITGVPVAAGRYPIVVDAADPWGGYARAMCEISVRTR